MEHSLTLKIIYAIFSTTLGLFFGSFLNAVIYRLPREISLTNPKRSQCPHCKTVIPWHHNIPLVSFLLLRGRCRNCQGPISWRYFFVELITGIYALSTFLLLYNYTPATWVQWFLSLAIFCCCLAHFFIDLEFRLLPDSLNLILGLSLFALSFYFNLNWSEKALGFLIGGGLPLLITWIYYKLRGEIGLGGGDIKLYAALGIFLGPLHVLENLFLSCFLGSLIAVGLIASKKIAKNGPIPFGPFIILVFLWQFLSVLLPDYIPAVAIF